MKNSIFFFLFLLSISSCRPAYEEFKEHHGIEVDHTPEEIPTESFLWIEELPYQTYYTSITPFLHKNLLISNHSLNVSHDVLSARNPETGEIVWQWNGYKNQSRKTLNKGIKVIEGLAYFSSAEYDYCVNLNTGKTVWDRNFLNSNSPMNVFPEEGIFLKVVDSDNSLWMGDLGESQNDKKLVRLGNELGTYSSLSHPQFFRNENGEAHIVFIASGSNNTQDRQFQVRCFNIETKQYSWIIEDFIQGNYGFNTTTPLIKDGIIYIKHRFGFYGIDLKSGEIRRELTNSSEWASNHILYQNLYISVISSQGKKSLFAFDLETNSVKWTQPIVNLENDLLSLQGDKISFSQNSTYVYDALTGNLLDQIDFSSPISSLNPVALDYENNRIFAIGGDHIFSSAIQE